MSFINKILSSSKQSTNHVDILGPYLVALIETALSDGIITRKEKEILNAIAIDEGIDLNVFNSYLTSQIQTRGIVYKDIESDKDENIVIDLEEIKKFNVLISKKIEIATSDGVLSAKEKLEILSEADKLGLNLDHLEVLLEKVIKKKEVSTVEKFGNLLIQMVDLALSDNKLTSDEIKVLVNTAAKQGVNIDEFTNYIDNQCKIKNVERVSDQVKAEIKRDVIQNSIAGDTFKGLMELAIADGEVSKEERNLLIEEGSKLGLSIEDVDLMIKTILAPAVPPAPKFRTIDPTDLQHTKKLVKVDHTPDGYVEEFWEYEDEELIPNNKPGATPGTMLLVKRKKTIRRRYKQNSNKSETSSVIAFLASVDYNMVSNVVSIISTFYAPVGMILTPVITILGNASECYKKSSIEERDQKFLMEIGKISLVGVLPLIKKYVKNGDKIADGLGTLIINK